MLRPRALCVRRLFVLNIVQKSLVERSPQNGARNRHETIPSQMGFSKALHERARARVQTKQEFNIVAGRAAPFALVAGKASECARAPPAGSVPFIYIFTGYKMFCLMNYINLIQANVVCCAVCVHASAFADCSLTLARCHICKSPASAPHTLPSILFRALACSILGQVISYS